MIIVILIAVAVLAGCNGEKRPMPVPQPLPIVPGATIDLTNGQFAVWFSPGMPAVVMWGAGVWLAREPASFHYTATPLNHSLAGYKEITFALEIEGDEPYPTGAGEVPPATCRLFVGRQDTTEALLRWWPTGARVLTLQPGVHEITVPIEPSAWSSVRGQNGASFLAEWTSIFSVPGNVGFSCSGQYFAGHGISTRGNTRITLRKYHIIPR